MLKKLFYRVQASIGDVRFIQPLADRFTGKPLEGGADQVFKLRAILPAPRIGNEARIAAQVRSLQNFVAEIAPLALILNSQVNHFAIASRKRTIGSNGRVPRSFPLRRRSSVGCVVSGI